MIPQRDMPSPGTNHDDGTIPGSQEAEPGLDLMTTLATLPRDAIISEQQFAQLFRRDITSVKRAIQRGELPPSVPLLNKQVWTAGVILAHLNDRLEAERKKVGESLRRVQQLRPGQGGRN